MKNGWKRKRISEIAQHSLGKMLDKAKNKGELKPYLRNINVRWFGFDLSDVLEMRFLPTEQAKYTAVKGDVFVCEGGYPGRAAIWEQDEPIYFQKALHRVRFYEPEHNKWFLYYLYACDLDGTLKKHFNGAGIQHFTGETLSQFEIPLPPLPEQRRIVGILDEAFGSIATARANAEKNLQNACALFESYLQAVFTQRIEGWEKKTIGQCFKVRSGDFLPAKAMVETGDIDVYGGNGIAGKHNVKNLSGENIIIGRVGAKCGNVRYVQGDLWLTDNAFYISEYFNEFDLAFLERLLTRKQLRSTANQAAQPVISYTTIKEVLLEFPVSKSEQKEIADKLDTLETETQRLESIYRRKLAALDELKKSLLHQAFNGEL